MNPTQFPYKEKASGIFESVKRPVAVVKIWSPFFNKWANYSMIVDTGADYTILPIENTIDLGIDTSKDCRKLETVGIGGKQTVYFYNKKIKIKIGDYELKIPVGFAQSGNIPAILGRQECLDNFKLTFHNFKTIFSNR